MRYLTGLACVRGGGLDDRRLRRDLLSAVVVLVVFVRREWLVPGSGRMLPFGLGRARRRRGLSYWMSWIRIRCIFISEEDCNQSRFDWVWRECTSPSSRYHFLCLLVRGMGVRLSRFVGRGRRREMFLKSLDLLVIFPWRDLFPR